MDVEGRDANITSEAFGSLACGSQTESQASSLTVHTSADKIEDALLCMPRYPDTVFKVKVNTDRMEIMDSWAQTNKTSEIHIPNFYKTLTECEPDAELSIRMVPAKKKERRPTASQRVEASVTRSMTTPISTAASSVPTAETGAIPKQRTDEKRYGLIS